MMMVELTYYKKSSGKFYTSAYIELPVTNRHIGDAIEEIRQMINSGKRPGLVDNANEFHTLVTCFTYHGPITHLIIG